MNKRSVLSVGAFLVLPSLLATGCATPRPTVPTFYGEAVLENGNYPRYRLQGGDRIEILYNLEYRKTGEDYSLDILDEIEIRVLDHDEVDGTYRIRTDGKITLPYKGSIDVFGMNVDELSAKLKELYSDIFVKPEIFINLTRFGARIEELKSIIASDQRGQIFEARVRPDGYVTLPVVGEVAVAGRTAVEIDELVSVAYNKLYSGIQVSTIISETPGNVFFVLGEVKQPGQFPLARPLTVTQALALAGVSMDTAGLSSVVVVNVSGSKPRGRVLDVLSIFYGGGTAGDMYLARDDVIFVPKSHIAEANLFVQQYIERLLMFRGFSFSYTVRGE